MRNSENMNITREKKKTTKYCWLVNAQSNLTKHSFLQNSLTERFYNLRVTFMRPLKISAFFERYLSKILVFGQSSSNATNMELEVLQGFCIFRKILVQKLFICVSFKAINLNSLQAMPPTWKWQKFATTWILPFINRLLI